jgi:heat shock protein HslJ
MHVDAAGRVVVNFAERAPGEAASAAPSHGRSLWLRFDPTDLSFGEVVQDFPGEADPARMQLGMTRWRAVRILREDGVEQPVGADATITLELDDDGTFSATSGCATLTGRTQSAPGRGSGAIAFLDIASVPHDCDAADAEVFRRTLAAVAAYRFTGRGELILSSADGKQTITFR